VLLLVLSAGSAAHVQVGREEAEGKSADAEGHVETAITTAIGAEMRAAAAVGIVTGVEVEVGGGKSPTAEEALEAAPRFRRRLGPLALRPRRNFVSRIGFVVGSASVERNEFIARNRRFADGASLAVRPSL